MFISTTTAGHTGSIIIKHLAETGCLVNVTAVNSKLCELPGAQDSVFGELTDISTPQRISLHSNAALSRGCTYLGDY